MAEPRAPSNLAIRLLTAAVAIPLLLLLIYKGPPWGLFLLVCVVTFQAGVELFGMTHPEDPTTQHVGAVATVAVSASVYFGAADARVLMVVLVFAPIFGTLFTLVRLGDMKTAALRALALGVGPLFCGGPISLLAVMRRDHGDRVGPGLVVFCLLVAWLSDTGGYFAGRFLGKRKLYEAVSPKKTVEGAIGGLLGSAMGGVLAHYVFSPGLPLVPVVGVSVVAGALGQAGDLGESLLKRSTGVKDSGQIVPGHGGILDRVDALMVVAAVVYVFSVFFLRVEP